jgi:hypothetical protein
MSDNIAIRVYFVLGYVISYPELDTAWYFTACKDPDKPINLLYEFEPTNMTVLIK